VVDAGRAMIGGLRVISFRKEITTGVCVVDPDAAGAALDGIEFG